MELAILSSQGIPADSILSIRAGSMRKQAALSACDKPFKFPCKVEECDAVKIEVLSVMGSARALCVGGGPQTHQLSLEASRSAALPPMEGEATLSIRLQAEGEGDGGDGSVRVSPERRKAKIQTETDVYMDKHSVSGALQGALKNLMRDRPDDPMAFLAKHFAQKQVGGALPPVAGSQASIAPTPAVGRQVGIAPAPGAGSQAGSAPAAADSAERMQALEAENMALRQQLASVARLASAGSGELSASGAPAESTWPPARPWSAQAPPRERSSSEAAPMARSASAVPAPQAEASAGPATAAVSADERGRAKSPTTEEQRRVQLKLRHEAELVKAAALERSQLMAEMGRIEALMEAARSQGAQKSLRSRGTSPTASSDPPSTRLPLTPTMSQR